MHTPKSPPHTKVTPAQAGGHCTPKVAPTHQSRPRAPQSHPREGGGRARASGSDLQSKRSLHNNKFTPHTLLE